MVEIMNMLKEEFDFYIKNQAGLVKDYDGKYIVIKDQKVQGAYDTQTEAYEKATAQFELGTFLIQLVTPGTEAYTQTFHSRVTF